MLSRDLGKIQLFQTVAKFDQEQREYGQKS